MIDCGLTNRSPLESSGAGKLIPPRHIAGQAVQTVDALRF